MNLRVVFDENTYN